MNDRELMLDYLRRVRERIATPDRWCQKSPAVDDKGENVYVNSDKACQWCIAGAMAAEHYLMSAKEGWESHHYQEAVRLVNNAACGNMIVFNDANTHAEVLAAVDRTLVCLSSQESEA